MLESVPKVMFSHILEPFILFQWRYEFNTALLSNLLRRRKIWYAIFSTPALGWRPAVCENVSALFNVSRFRLSKFEVSPASTRCPQIPLVIKSTQRVPVEQHAILEHSPNFLLSDTRYCNIYELLSQFTSLTHFPVRVVLAAYLLFKISTRF